MELQLAGSRCEQIIVLRLISLRFSRISKRTLLWNSVVELQGVDSSGNETSQLFVRECLRINTAAYTERCHEEVNLYESSGSRIDQKLRLVADPVNIKLLSRDPLHKHTAP